MILPAIAMVITALIMLIMIRILSRQAIEYDIKQELKKSLYENMQYLSVSEDGLEISDDFRYEMDKVVFVVVNRSGRVVAGEYPEAASIPLMELPVANQNAVAIVCEDEKYYVRDIRIKKSKGMYLRAVIGDSDADSPYETMEIVSYISIVSVFCAVLVCELFLAKKISKGLKYMCQTAEQIGSNLDMSQRMKCDNQFREVAVLAQANNRMLDRMENTFQMQEQFTSDVAHELRTPVTVVLAQCQYAREKVETRDEFHEVLDVVYRQSKKINTIITQLLNFSRLDQDRVQLENETLDLVEIVESVCEEQQDKAGDEVSIQLNLKEAVTRGDISLIAIAIQNLVGNAVKFSRRDGKIEVKTGEEDGKVYVMVSDHGIGIEQDKLECIFRRFYKCDQSRNEGGFGLGLPLSEKIAEKHGGNITVSSKVGMGSIFTLYLPKK